MDNLYQLLNELDIPQEAWIDEFDAFDDTIRTNVGEHMDEGTENNPRFKCMEEKDVEMDDRFILELRDEDGSMY